MRRSSVFLPPFVTAVILGGIVLCVQVASSSTSWASLETFEYWILATGVVAGEFIRIRIPRGSETLMVTIGDPFVLALLFTLGLGPAILAKLVATLLDDIRRRQTWWKVLFNLSQFSLSISLAHLIVTSLGHFPFRSGPMDVRSVGIALLGSVAYFIFNITVVNTAIAMSIDQSPIQVIKETLRSRVLHQGMLIGFTPVVMVALANSLWLFPLLLVPIVLVYHSGTMLQKQISLAEQLRELYEVTRTTRGSTPSQEWVHDLLRRICQMFNASSAIISLLPRDGQPAMLTRLDTTENAFEPWTEAVLDPTKGVWARIASEDRAALLSGPISNHRLREHYEAAGIKDVMAAPLHSEGAVLGVISVHNRIGDPATFTNEDLHLFETLSNHASIALENNRLIDELENSLAHLTEMNQLKDDFVASVSHELRTPLTSIRGYVKTLLRPDANFGEEDRRMFLETVDRQSNRLHRLIEDLLAVSRIESEGDPSAMTMLSLRPLAEEVADELRGKAEGHTIDVRVPQDLPLVQTDASKVHQIVSNLVDNALKYSPKGTMVAVVAVVGASAAGGVTVSVTDHGPGIPADFQDKIFDRFYQVDQSATRKVGGTGLGLYICKRMAEAIGGRVWLEKSDEEGSTFSLWIPSSVPSASRHGLVESHN